MRHRGPVPRPGLSPCQRQPVLIPLAAAGRAVYLDSCLHLSGVQRRHLHRRHCVPRQHHQPPQPPPQRQPHLRHRPQRQLYTDPRLFQKPPVPRPLVQPSLDLVLCRLPSRLLPRPRRPPLRPQPHLRQPRARRPLHHHHHQSRPQHRRSLHAPPRPPPRP